MYCFLCHLNLNNYLNNNYFYSTYSKELCFHCNKLYTKYKQKKYFSDRRIQISKNITHIYIY